MPIRFLALLMVAFSVPAVAAPPNIVLIVADDLGWNDVGYHGSKNNRTPNIDALAEKGLKLERFYAYPMCNPTRRALMTGMSAVKIQGMAAKAELGNGHLPLELETMPQLFRKAGYQAFMDGKVAPGQPARGLLPNQPRLRELSRIHQCGDRLLHPHRKRRAGLAAGREDSARRGLLDGAVYSRGGEQDPR